MSTLPPGWAYAEFIDLIEESQNGFSARQGTGTPTVVLRLADVTIGGAIAVTNLREIPLSDAERKKYSLRQGDLLAFRVNGSPQITGQVICYPGPDGFAYCDHFIRFRLRNHTLLPALAAYAFRTWPARDQVASGMVSTAGQNTVSQKTYGAVQLFLPPIPEQQRIVDAIESYLSRLDDAVATLERVERSLKRYRASVLKSAVEGRLVPNEAALAKQEGRPYEPASVLLERILNERRRRWSESGKKGKYQDPTPPDTTNLPNLPEGWCWATVEQLGRVESGQTPSGIAEVLVSEGDIPWFRVGDMNSPGNENFMIVCSSWLAKADVLRLGLHVRPEGTIIFPKRGGAIATNKKRRLSRPSSYDLNTMGIVPVDLSADYLWMWFAQLDLGGISDGSNVPQINHGDIAPLCVPLPPLSEQQRIINEVEAAMSVADAARNIVLRDLVRARRLRQSILKWAYEGKLADQDPNDEPASVLLARIKAGQTTDKLAKTVTPKRKAAKKKA